MGMKEAKLILTNTYFDNFPALISSLGGKANTIGGKNLIFCQEKVSLMVERRICDSFGGSFNTEVYSFGNYMRAKKPLKNLLTKEGSAMAVKKILSEIPLGCFKQSRKNLAPSLFELIMQLKSAKITPEKLSQSIEGTGGILKSKLTDIANVYCAYEEFIKRENLEDQNSALSYLSEVIEEDQTISGADVYIVGFESFTAQIRQAIFCLLKKANSVTAILTAGENPFAYVNETAQSFSSLCKLAKVECTLKNWESGLNIEGKLIAKNLFNPAIRGCTKIETDKIYFNSYPNIYDEIDATATQIKRAVLGGEYRYRDFSIVLPEVEKYKEELKKAFSLLEIPYFLDEKKKAESHPLITAILSYIDIFKNGWERANLCAFFKNPFICEDKNLTDSLETYILKYNINYSRFKEPFVFEAPDGADIEVLNKLREYVCSLLKEFNVRNLLAQISAEQKSEQATVTLADLGESEQSAINAQVYDAVISLLDEMDKLLGGVKLDLSEFKSVFLSGVSALEISIIPQYTDAVFIGDFKQISLAKAKKLFVLGLNASVPAIKEDIALLSDCDIDAIPKIEISSEPKIEVMIEPKIKVINHRTRENVGMGLCAFEENLYLSYSVSGIGGEQNFKSEILDYFERLFSVKELLKPEEYEYLTVKQGEQSFARACSDFSEGRLDDFSTATAFYKLGESGRLDEILERAGKEIKIRLEKNREILVKEYASPTYIEDYHRCPYKAFMTRGLNLKQREEGSADHRSFGILMHEIFRAYIERCDEVSDLASSDKLFESVRDEIMSREEFALFLKDGAGAASILLSLNECKKYCYKLFKGLELSKFKTDKSLQEVKFGDSKGCKYPAIKLLNGKVRLTGKIDRVDVYKDYCRIIDYKTGKVDCSEKSLFAGVKLQLYLYAKAVDDKKPAGMYYCSIDDSFAKEEKKQKGMFEGVTLDVENNADFKGEEGGASINSVYGEEVKSALNGDTMSAHVKYAVSISERAVERMSEGVIAPLPYGEECSYCEFGAMCGMKGKSRAIGGVDENIIAESVREAE